MLPKGNILILTVAVLCIRLAGCSAPEKDIVNEAQARIAKNPNDVALRIEEVDKLLAAEKSIEATLILNEGLSLSPDNLQLLEKMSKLYVDLAMQTESEMKYTTAERYLERWLEVGGPNADVHHMLAWTYNRQGKYLDATIACKAALELDSRHTGALKEYVNICLNRAKYEQGLTLLTKIVPQDWFSMKMKFQLEYKVGNYDEALATIENMRAIASSDQLEWLDEWEEMITPLTIQGKSDVAHYRHEVVADEHREAHRYDHAIREYKAALNANVDDGSKKATYCFGENNFQIGRAYSNVQQYETAVQYFEKSVKYLEKAGRIDRLAVAYNALGGSYGVLSRIDEINKTVWLEKQLHANKMVEKYGTASNNNHIVLHALGSIIHVQLDMDGLEGVDPEYENRLDAYLPEKNQVYSCDIGSVVSAKARLYYEREEYEQALELYLNRLYAEENEGKYSEELQMSSTCSNISLVHWKLGNFDSMLEYAGKGLEHLELTRAQHAVDAFKRSAGALTASDLLFLTIQAAMNLYQPETALTYVERAKGRALLDLLGTRSFSGGEEDSKKLSSDEEFQLTKVNQLEDQAEEARTTGNEEQLQSILRTLSVERTRYNRLKEDLESAGKNILSFESMPSLNSSEIEAFINGFTFISYTLMEEEGYALVVNADGVHGITLANAGQELIENLVSEVKHEVLKDVAETRDLAFEQIRPTSTIITPNDKTTALDFSNEEARKTLYNLLIQPVEHLVDTELVYICPDESLNFLPFEVLQDETEKYLVEKYAISYTASASVLKYCMDREQLGRESFFALGNPNLMNPALRLYNAENEVNEVGKLFSNSSILTFEQATETAFKLLAGRNDVLHLACHGELNQDNPMMTALRLTPDDNNDGYLHAGEVFDLSLNASLVVLSACESGLGELSTGNELMGLTRAFLYAGAPSVIASLWKVDDRSTAFLMEAFYKNLSTMNKAEALRQAKLETMKEFPDPFHWAAFRLEGDYR